MMKAMKASRCMAAVIAALMAVCVTFAGCGGSSGKTEKVAKSGKLDKALNGEWKECDEIDVFSFDKGKFSLFDISDGTMTRGTFGTSTKSRNGTDTPLITLTWAEDYNFETGKWVAKEKPSTSEFFYQFTDDDTFEMENSKGTKWTYKKGKYLKELTEKATADAKRLAEIKSMSADKLKKQASAPEADFEVKPADDSYTGIEITKYKGSDPLVVIPATMQGLSVKRIGKEAFANNNNVVAVVIPEGVTRIGWRSFYECSNLSSIVIPEGVTYIGESAFYKCTNLFSVVLPSTMKAIEEKAFENCSSLKSVNLPDGLLFIGPWAFDGCTGLTSVSLPKSLRLLGYYAFSSCNSLAEIQISADHAITCAATAWAGSPGHEREHPFEIFFSGTKIKESIALQKLLKETTTRATSGDEYRSIGNDIAKQIGAKNFVGDGGGGAAEFAW